ncbi:MAG: hypothetical protein AB1806_02310 [Acidobacteriota bacterium]
MRAPTIAAIVFAAAVTPAAAWTHTRPLTPGAAALIADAADRSSIIESLLQALERTDVVVYVSDQDNRSASMPQACLRWLSAAGGLRYVLVQIAPWQTMPLERIAWLGHELQHALEIAQAPDVRDADGVARLYRRIGWEEGHNHFESDAARRIGDLVRDELAGFTLPFELITSPEGPRPVRD